MVDELLISTAQMASSKSELEIVSALVPMPRGHDIERESQCLPGPDKQILQPRRMVLSRLANAQVPHRLKVPRRQRKRRGRTIVLELSEAVLKASGATGLD